MPSILLPMIELEALPLLRQIETLDDLETTIPKEMRETPGLGWMQIKEFPIAIARGDLSSAKRTADMIRMEAPVWKSPDLVEVRDKVLHPLCDMLVSGDRTGLASLLHEWEGQSVRALNLEHIWEPTPFPLELTR